MDFFGKTHTIKEREAQSRRKKGVKLSEEHKKEISNGMIGKNTWMLGKKRTKETKEKHSIQTKKLWNNRTKEDLKEIGNKITEAKLKEWKERKLIKDLILDPIIKFPCELCDGMVIHLRSTEISKRLEKYNKFICKNGCANKLRKAIQK